MLVYFLGFFALQRNLKRVEVGRLEPLKPRYFKGFNICKYADEKKEAGFLFYAGGLALNTFCVCLIGETHNVCAFFLLKMHLYSARPLCYN